MDYRFIPNTELNVSSLALGTWVFGGEGWGGFNADEGLNVVAAAAEQGINFIDTAPVYGQGRSEEIVGRALQGRRDCFIVATKCGLVSKGGRVGIDLSLDSILQEVDASLRRLRVERIDLYQCHWPDPKTPVSDTMEALTRLQSVGKIRYFGVSNFTVPLLDQCRQSGAKVVTLQSPYSLLNRAVEKEILPWACRQGVGVLTYGALAGGILSGKYREPPVFPKGDVRQFFYKHYSGPAFAQSQKLLKFLEKFGRPSGQLALNWVRQQKGITSVLVGARSVSQLVENTAAATWQLTDAEIQEIASFHD